MSVCLSSSSLSFPIIALLNVSKCTQKGEKGKSKKACQKALLKGVVEEVNKQIVTANDVQSKSNILCRFMIPVVHTLVAFVQHNVCRLVKPLQHTLLCSHPKEQPEDL